MIEAWMRNELRRTMERLEEAQESIAQLKTGQGPEAVGRIQGTAGINIKLALMDLRGLIQTAEEYEAEQKATATGATVTV